VTQVRSVKNVVFLVPDYSKYQIDRRIRDQAKLFSSRGYEVYLVLLGDYVQFTRQESYNILTVDRIFQEESYERVLSLTSYSKFSSTKPINDSENFVPTVWDSLKFGKALQKIYLMFPTRIKERIRGIIYSGIFELVKNFIKESRSTDIENREIFNIAARLASCVNLEEVSLFVGADLPGALAARSLKSRYPETPIWFDAHEFFCEQERIKKLDTSQTLRLLELEMVKDADYFTCVTPELTSMMNSESKRTGPSFTMTNSTKFLVKTSSLTIKQELGLMSKHILLFNGGLADVRDLQRFIKLFEVVAGDSWRLVIMGYWASENLKNQIKASSKTIMIQPESNITLLERICDVDAIVAPYPPVDINTTYCFPNKMGDAIAIKKPLIFNEELKFMKRISNSFNFVIPFHYGQNEAESLKFALEAAINRNFEWETFDVEYGWGSFEDVFNQIEEGLK
jgi:hypothetical protein